MSYAEAVQSMSYEERVRLALSHIGEDPGSFSRGDWFLTSFPKGNQLPEYVCRVECVGVLDNAVLFVCIDTITRRVNYYQTDCAKWSYTAFLLDEVDEEFQSVYRNWLDSHGYSLAPELIELDGRFQHIEQIIGWKHHEE